MAARSQPYYLDVTNAKANKGEVVLMLAETLEIPVEQIATIGNMPSDVLIFRESGVSTAMENASADVQRARRHSSRPRTRKRASPTRWNNSSCGSKNDCGVD